MRSDDFGEALREIKEHAATVERARQAIREESVAFLVAFDLTAHRVLLPVLTEAAGALEAQPCSWEAQTEHADFRVGFRARPPMGRWMSIDWQACSQRRQVAITVADATTTWMELADVTKESEEDRIVKALGASL